MVISLLYYWVEELLELGTLHKDKTRKILEEKTIEKNIKNIKKILEKFLKTKNQDTTPIFVNNYDWLKNLIIFKRYWNIYNQQNA